MSAFDDALTRRAVGRWDELVAGLPDRDAWAEEILAGQEAVGLFHGGEPAVRVARPEFITDSEWDLDRQVVTAAAAALVAAGEAVLADPALERQYFGDWLEDPVIAGLSRIDPGYADKIVLGRFDGVRGADGLSIMEFNGGLPGGAMPADVGARYLAGWPMFPAFGAEFDVTLPEVRDAVVAAWIATWHDFGGTGLPRTVIALPDELRSLVLPSLAEFDGAIAAAALPVRVADPGQLQYAQGGLSLDGEPVDLVVRAFFTSMFTALGSRLDGLLAALRAGDLCMIASIQSGVFGHKSLFALLTDPDVELDLTAHDRETVIAHLPWTRMVDSGTASLPDGTRGDLRRYALAHRDSLVIKPAAGYGGTGVELGWEHDAASWEQVFDAALAAGAAIVQKRIPLLERDYPMLAPGLPVERLNVDYNPIYCRGDVPGYFIRASTGGITNVTGGHGSLVPAFRLTGPVSGT
jgi:hypothetical protein